MRPEEAERIVNEYGGVLEKAASQGSAHPVSMLRYEKGTMKRAILSHMAALKAMGELTEEMRNHLGVGYVELAGFIEDEQAQHVIEWGQAMLQGTFEERLENPVLSRDSSEHYFQISRRISEEAGLLLAELRGFEKEIGLTSHYKPESQERNRRHIRWKFRRRRHEL